MAELIMEVRQGKNSLIKRIAENVKYFYDQILVDEFQDFRENDYDLICALAKYGDNVTLIGDYYQHSVSANKNTGRPFQKKNKNVSYEEFVNTLKKIFYVDDSSMGQSRRCSEDVCQFVSEKLKINIQSKGIRNGSVYWVSESQIDEILNNTKIVKLLYKISSKFTFEAVNWSYSKGDTYDETCVILTDDFAKLDNDSFDVKTITQSTVNKLYVALTRTQGDLYLVKKTIFDKVKKNYLKNPTNAPAH